MEIAIIEIMNITIHTVAPIYLFGLFGFGASPVMKALSVPSLGPSKIRLLS
jgi:hypothetical protein